MICDLVGRAVYESSVRETSASVASQVEVPGRIAVHDTAARALTIAEGLTNHRACDPN